jgi:hypothetical protein
MDLLVIGRASGRSLAGWRWPPPHSSRPVSPNSPGTASTVMNTNNAPLVSGIKTEASLPTTYASLASATKRPRILGAECDWTINAPRSSK